MLGAVRQISICILSQMELIKTHAQHDCCPSITVIDCANLDHFHSAKLNNSAPEMNAERTQNKNNRYILCWSRVIWSYWQRKLFLNDGHASGMNNGAICYFEHKPVVAATALLFTVQFCNNLVGIVISGDFGAVTETEKDRWRLMCFVRRKQMEGSIHYVNCNPEDNFSIVIYSHILTW